LASSPWQAIQFLLNRTCDSEILAPSSAVAEVSTSPFSLQPTKENTRNVMSSDIIKPLALIINDLSEGLGLRCTATFFLVGNIGNTPYFPNQYHRNLKVLEYSLKLRRLNAWNGALDTIELSAL